MKLLKKSILAVTMMTSFSAFSAVDVYFEQGIEALIINGDGVNNLATQLETTELKDGANQFVVRISKLIREQGKFIKFKSQPVVITFEAHDEKLTVQAGKKFDSVEQVGDFDKKPTVNLLDSKGNKIDFHMGYLVAGKGLIRDFDEELVQYNSEREYSFSYADSAVAATSSADKAVSTVESSTKSVQFSLADTDDVESIKKMYSKLSESKRKAFLSWAIVQ